MKTEKQIYFLKFKWPEIRQNKKKYLFRNAILFWSIPVTIMNNIFRVLVFDQGIRSWQVILFDLILFTVVGFLWSDFQFKSNEKKYQEFLKHQSEEVESTEDP